MVSSHWIAGGAVLLCGTAAWWDLRYRRIPNVLTFPAAALALYLHGASHSGPGLFLSLAGALAAAGMALPGYAFRFTGAGDVKLLAAVGALLAFPTAVVAALLSFVLAGVLCILVSLWRRDLADLVLRTFGLGHWLLVRSMGVDAPPLERSGRGVPLGVAIAVATLVVVFSPWPGSKP